MSTTIIKQGSKVTKENFGNKSTNIDLQLLAAIDRSLGIDRWAIEIDGFFLGPEALRDIKNNFLIKKLDLRESEVLNIDFLTKEFMKSGLEESENYFYYFLVKYFHKESLFLESDEAKLLDFGEGFIKNQKDLEHDIVEIIDKNYFSLF